MSVSHRRPVPLSKAYRLLNHGPTVLVSAAHDGQRNIMAAAWAMPLDFEPPKIAVVLDKSTWTRQLLEASGTFVLNVPCSPGRYRPNRGVDVWPGADAGARARQIPDL
jgi:flavin reductase (DIM6/NTAB) family NADH-FMN oxidoreductase RutF